MFEFPPLLDETNIIDVLDNVRYLDISDEQVLMSVFDFFLLTIHLMRVVAVLIGFSEEIPGLLLPGGYVSPFSNCGS